MKRITRDRRLTPEEAAKYKTVREQVDQELPELTACHNERMVALDQLHELFVSSTHLGVRELRPLARLWPAEESLPIA